MSDSPVDSTTSDGARRRRFLPLLWLAGAGAAALLALGVSGTLSSWTQAILTNGNNQAGTTSSVVLQETGPGSDGSPVTCTTSGSTTNTATCDTINKYGDGGVLDTTLAPGGTISTTVTLTNTGSGAASTFTLAPGACSSVYNTGTNAPNAPAAVDDLCGELQVAVSCSGGATLNLPAQTLAAFAAGSPYTLSSGLASGATASCQFTVSLPSNAPANFSGQTSTQPIVWTIGA